MELVAGWGGSIRAVTSSQDDPGFRLLALEYLDGLLSVMVTNMD